MQIKTEVNDEIQAIGEPTIQMLMIRINGFWFLMFTLPSGILFGWKGERMRTIRYVIVGLKGFAIGLFVGLGMLFIGDSVSQTPVRIAEIIEAPVYWLTDLVSPPPAPDGSPAAGSFKWFFIFHFIYWGLLGSLVSIGVNWLRERLTGED